MNSNFLPVTKEEIISLGWDAPDFVFVTGDAYVDHPSFACAILSRVLESKGFKVAILPQPSVSSDADFKRFGKPRLGFLVSAGNIDSMVAHYTAAKKKRHDDAYSPGGKAGYRPDRATISYCNRIRQAYKDVPIIIGGIEASLRRFAHYDYWDDKVRRSVLFDSGADLLIYGMGERILTEVAVALNNGFDIKQLTYIDGTVYIADNLDGLTDYELCPSFKDVSTSKTAYAKSVKLQYTEHNPIKGKTIVQEHDGKYIVANKPAMPLSRTELDRVFALKFERKWHPMYDDMGGIPAIEEVQFSIISSRGCYGGCNFCALAFHQGRMVQSRSHKSIITEAEKFVWNPDFKGYIHDVGGPTANFRDPACDHQLEHGVCTSKQCMAPKLCPNMKVSHSDYLDLLRKLRKIKGVKKVFIRSGLRFDYIMADKNDEFFNELCEHHISGQLKVAPEHVCDEVLRLMGKPKNDVYNAFKDKFYKINEKIGKKQYLVPYLMSSHPGSTLRSAIKLALYLKKEGLNPQQVQDFYPTPGTISTCMYYTGLDPMTMKKVYVAKSPEEKRMQRALLQYKKPENAALVRKALVQAGREDLIGYGKECLIRPERKGVSSNVNTNNKRQGSFSKNKRGAQKSGGRAKGKRH
ncbi:MAG: YgiQ family radical SAM protein [Clostridia bacterium]|nr:YgiQ family radical SAM protein [Clostridia bacterium]